jgi:hypothetical protein
VYIYKGVFSVETGAKNGFQNQHSGNPDDGKGKTGCQNMFPNHQFGNTFWKFVRKK